MLRIIFAMGIFVESRIFKDFLKTKQPQADV